MAFHKIACAVWKHPADACDCGATPRHTGRTIDPSEPNPDLKRYVEPTASEIQGKAGKDDKYVADEPAPTAIEALEKIADWPDGGNTYGQANIKKFARKVLDAAPTAPAQGEVDHARATRLSDTMLRDDGYVPSVSERQNLARSHAALVREAVDREADAREAQRIAYEIADQVRGQMIHAEHSHHDADMVHYAIVGPVFTAIKSEREAAERRVAELLEQAANFDKVRTIALEFIMASKHPNAVATLNAMAKAEHPELASKALAGATPVEAP